MLKPLKQGSCPGVSTESLIETLPEPLTKACPALRPAQYRRPPRRKVDGVLLLDKPQGLSSNTALQHARRLLNAAKAGHTGTLDPMATGLLPLTFGEATKFSQRLLDADKCYETRLQLGVSTDSGDAEGEIIARAPVQLTPTQLDEVLARFRGAIEQLPPMHSALKHAGKPLYEYARAGLEIERQPRPVQIHALELLGLGEDWIDLRVHCSKGTYIRTLAMDIGAALGCGAHLSSLRRTAIGDFSLEAAISLDALQQADEAARDQLLAPVDALLADYPLLELDAEQSRLLLQGRSVALGTPRAAGPVRIYGHLPESGSAAVFLGLGDCTDGLKLQARRLVATS